MSAIRYRDKFGKEITMEEWARLLNDREYCRVKYDEVNGYKISTVWLGLNQQYYDYAQPEFFETMVFGLSGNADEEMERYHDLKEAQEGHERMYARYKFTKVPAGVRKPETLAGDEPSGQIYKPSEGLGGEETKG